MKNSYLSISWLRDGHTNIKLSIDWIVPLSIALFYLLINLSFIFLLNKNDLCNLRVEGEDQKTLSMRDLEELTRQVFFFIIALFILGFIPLLINIFLIQ